MATEKQSKELKARFQQKTDKSENWYIAGNKGFIPKKGEIIVYQEEKNSASSKIKIGDGHSKVTELSFFAGEGSGEGGGVGKATENGGEIFCDYENNKADLHGHAEGEYTTAGWRGHAECYLTEAGNSAHAEGRLSRAIGKGSHAEGLEYNTFFSEGEGGILLAEDVSIESNKIKLNKIPTGLEIGHAVYLTSYKNIVITPTDVKIVKEIDASSNTVTLHSPFKALNYTGSGASNPEVIPAGVQLRKAIRTTASGLGSHAEGFGTTALVEGAHSEGQNTIAASKASHAEGMNTKSYSVAGHTEGYATQAGVTPGNVEVTGDTSCAHAEGNNTKAYAFASHAEGQGTTASGGKSHAEGYNTIASGENSHAEGQETKNYSQAGHAEGFKTQAGVNPDSPEIESSDTSCAHAEGANTKAHAFASHAEGNLTTSSGSKAHAEGYNTTASGESSHAEGSNTTASNLGSHAEGLNTIASGTRAHAEGESSSAFGGVSHAEGKGTEASGNHSHAEGLITVASGNQTHAEGWKTIAASENQHVQGKCNIEDAANKYAHIVGNGTSDTKRSNAHTLDWNGNGWFAGKLTVGANPTEDMDVVTLKYLNNVVGDIESALNEIHNYAQQLIGGTT